MPEHPKYPAPPGLSERAQALWSAVVPAQAISAGRRALVEEALRSLDRADEMREAVDHDGALTTNATTGMVHVHPCCKIEREARQAFARLWTTMHLEWSRADAGRL